MSTWNFADLFERMAVRFPAMTVVIDGDRSLTWSEFEERAAGLASDLQALGIQAQGKVAVYSRNRSEFLESYFGIMKARLVPVNVNWRYQAEELVYVLENADVEAVIVESEFCPMIEEIAGQLPNIRRWYVIGDTLPSGIQSASYDEVVIGGRDGQKSPLTRSGDDLILIYTGGTTGMPKGVMWRQGDMFEALIDASREAFGLPATESVDELVAGISKSGPRGLSASPFMHATGLLHQFVMLVAGGSTVVLNGRRFDASNLWQIAAKNKVTSIVIVGDAFALPMLEVLDQYPAAFDLSSLEVISSSGAIWSQAVKERLLRHLPWVTLFDSLASSEGFGLGVNTSDSGTVGQRSAFRLGSNVRVRSIEGRWLENGESGIGMLAVGEPLPLGYYKDPTKTSETFQWIDSCRYCVPGDYVEVLADSSIRFLGRGSASINTGGEKVYAEEVELVVKDHPAVLDAACIGMPHPRLGAEVWIIVQESTEGSVSLEDLVTHVKSRLAGYKVPRRLILTPSIPRTAQGKIDYPRLRELAESQAS